VSLIPVGKAIGTTTVVDPPVSITQAPKAPYQTIKTFTGTLTTSTTVVVVQNLYVVTTGKTFYLTDFYGGNSSSNNCLVSVNASATPAANPVATGHAINTSPLSMINIGSEPPVAGGASLTFQVGATTVATTISYTIYGYEQ
jgi:hypothetical protein